MRTLSVNIGCRGRPREAAVLMSDALAQRRAKRDLAASFRQSHCGSELDTYILCKMSSVERP